MCRGSGVLVRMSRVRPVSSEKAAAEGRVVMCAVEGIVKGVSEVSEWERLDGKVKQK